MRIKNFIQTHINKMRGRRLLNKALALLRNDGWTFGREYNQATGARCAIGAIHAAAGYPLTQDGSMFYENQYDPLVEQVKNAVAAVIVKNGGCDLQYPQGTITHFNDRTGRIERETAAGAVIAAFEEAKWVL